MSSTIKKVMNEIIYIVVNKKGVQNKTIYKNPPPLNTGDLYIKLNIELPISIFEVPPIEGTIKLSESEALGKTIKQLEFELKQLKEVK